jgi:hypothetical protein
MIFSPRLGPFESLDLDLIRAHSPRSRRRKCGVAVLRFVPFW